MPLPGINQLEIVWLNIQRVPGGRRPRLKATPNLGIGMYQFALPMRLEDGLLLRRDTPQEAEAEGLQCRSTQYHTC